jgi:2'-5' RNA ligase
MTKRIFAAIDISNEAKDRVAEYIKILRSEFPDLRVGWEKTEKFHLTLKFLGDIDDSDLQRLNDATFETAGQISKFNLQTGDTGAFPSKKKARVLWLGIKDEKGILQKLAEVFETKCAKHGFAKDTRSFKAHLTIARLREPGKSKELIEKHLETKIEPAQFEVSEIVIYESHLQKTGSIYSVVSKHKLEENITADS